MLGGKPYYPGGAYTFLFAAGCVPAERWLRARRGQDRRGGAGRPCWRGGPCGLPIALPVLPAAALRTVPLQKINYDLAESIAWPQQVALVAREYHALPAAQRARTTILAGNYGEAGAVDRYGAGFGLPAAYSGATTSGSGARRPPRTRSAIAINLDPACCAASSRTCAWSPRSTTDSASATTSKGARIYLATGLRKSWARAWPAFRNYS